MEGKQTEPVVKMRDGPGKPHGSSIKIFVT